MNPKLKIFILIFLGALFLLFAAYINGFPIVYSDTSTYLASGFEFETPFDRPITYGLFLRFASLNGASLWLVILAQGMILSYLIFELLKSCLPARIDLSKIFIGLMIFLSIFTSVSWSTSQLISDVFTPIMLLSMLLLLIVNSTKRVQVVLYFIFLLSTAMHMSHITFNVVFIVSLFVVRRLNFLDIGTMLKVKPLLICLGLTFLSVFTMGSALSKSRHGFFMGAMVEHGIAKAYLDDNCDCKYHKLCAYKDTLPEKGWQFLWNEDSPFYEMGGWKGTQEEFSEIIYNTLTTPKYIMLHIKESIKATGDQMTMFKIGDGNGSFLKGTLLHERIEAYFSHEIDSYEVSGQSTEKLQYLEWYNKILTAVIIISVLLLLLLMFKIRSLDKEIVLSILFIVLSVFINAWACGTFANAIDRLGSKVVWLIPLITIIGILNIWSDRNTLVKG